MLDIIRHIDDKMLTFTLKRYQGLQSEHGNAIKPHSFITVIAILVTVAPPLSGIGFENAYGQGFIDVLKVLMIAVCIALYYIGLYSWRVFFRLKSDGINNDRNLFFAESAGPYRKLAFYISFAIDFTRRIQANLHPEAIEQRMRRLKYQFRAEYYQDAGAAILESIVLSILLVEIIRIILPGTVIWSDKKHALAVIIMSVSMSSFRVFFLSLASGHGVF